MLLEPKRTPIRTPDPRGGPSVARAREIRSMLHLSRAAPPMARAREAQPSEGYSERLLLRSCRSDCAGASSGARGRPEADSWRFLGARSQAEAQG